MNGLSQKQLNLGRELKNDGFKLVQMDSTHRAKFKKENLTIILIPKVCQ